MSALAEVAAAGGRVWAEGEKLKYRLPKGRADLLASLKAHKAEILAELRAKDSALLARCRDACRGLPVSPGALLASLAEEDKGAIRTGDPDELKALRTFAECLAARTKPALDSKIEAAYRWCRAELARRPEIHRAVCSVDPDADPVLLALAVRGIGCITIRIKKANYQGREFELLELLHRAGVAESATTEAKA